FQTFRRVLDSEMKATHREGKSLAENRTRREKEAITDDDEGLLWSKGLLGDKTAQSLVYTIYFYIHPRSLRKTKSFKFPTRNLISF
ncbi:Hypothetical predicted protein, partial [Paramuricea clavata]